jgi:hypothetical protein
LVTTENGRSYLNQNVAAFFRAEKAVFPEKSVTQSLNSEKRAIRLRNRTG